MEKLKNLPEIILVNTQLPENLGAVARSMLNFNFKKLKLVSPEFNLNHEKIRPVCAGADIVIDKTRVYENFDEAIKHFNIIIATTNRIRSIKQKVISFSHLSNILKNNKNKIGIVFGPERSGLDNNKIALCDYVLKINTNKKFSSLNLSHAVNLICYEISRIGDKTNNTNHHPQKAKKSELINFMKLLINDLDEKEFFLIKERKKIMTQKIMNIFNKIDLTSDDIKILIGIFKALKKRGK